MAAMMDWLHLKGVELIVASQHYCKDQSELMLFLSFLGDPRNAFLVYFPLVYFCHLPSGVKVIWAGAISEWLNAVFKWLLFGHRPYWWVHVTSLYEPDSRPHLDQFRLTCETGPGSPSGHAMVTAAVWYLIVKSILTLRQADTGKRLVWSVALWVGFSMAMLLVSVSRCFIAAHFPHQVVFGTITGIVIGEVCFRLPAENASLRTYTLSALLILLSTPATYWLLETLGYDPLWSITYAKQWCAQQKYVYVDTTPFFAITRDASILAGTGLALWNRQHLFKGKGEKTEKPQELGASTAHIASMVVVSVLITRGLEYIRLPHDNLVLFYVLGFFRYLMLPVLVVAVVPAVCGVCFNRKSKAKER